MYKNNYMVVRGEQLNMVHISEINTIIVDSTMVNITSSLLCELIKNKVKIVFCNEKHNPISELIPYYGCHNTSKKVQSQIKWDDNFKVVVWTNIIQQKIINQASFLHKLGFDTAGLLYDYSQNIEYYDSTNREGHAAKVYFNSLFGKGFSRDDSNCINAALDYGYSILLSNFNREIVSNGYLTQLGIKHINEYNYFNLSSDLMEPLRIVVDKKVYENLERGFDSEYKYELVELLSLRVQFDGKEHYLSNVIQIYVKKIFQAIENRSIKDLILFQYP